MSPRFAIFACLFAPLPPAARVGVRLKPAPTISMHTHTVIHTVLLFAPTVICSPQGSRDSVCPRVNHRARLVAVNTLLHLSYRPSVAGADGVPSGLRTTIVTLAPTGRASVTVRPLGVLRADFFTRNFVPGAFADS